MGGEVLKLKPEILQQQQEEGRNRQPQSGENVRDEQHELAGLQIAERKTARLNPPGKLGGRPPKHTAHRIQTLLGLVAARTAKGRHCCGGAGCKGGRLRKVRRCRGLGRESNEEAWPQSVAEHPISAHLAHSSRIIAQDTHTKC